MFEPFSSEVVVDVDAASGEPLRFGGIYDVTDVHGRWREWDVTGLDTECWRVESGADLVVVLAHDLARRCWAVREVWD